MATGAARDLFVDFDPYTPVVVKRPALYVLSIGAGRPR